MNRIIYTVKPEDISELLPQITDPPKSLRMQGEFPKGAKANTYASSTLEAKDREMKYLTVVGSRKYSDYGKTVCEYLIAGLRGYPICIISGLALGMDGIALRAALAAQLPTVAVPGSGLSDKAIHPKTNIGIRDAILEAGGCVLSEFEDDFRATLYSFPQRNRIMAGLAHATLIIEAKLKSGTLITSKYATEYNRDVFTVPHPIFSSTSEGPHMLLRLGATPITKPEDILDAFGFIQGGLFAPKDYSDCSPDEMLVVNLLSEPLERDEIIRTINKPIHVTQAILSIMEIKGLIREEMGEIRLI
jgi:DNA processing protein